MASIMSSLRKSLSFTTFANSSLKKSLLFQSSYRFYSAKSSPAFAKSSETTHREEDDAVPTSGLSRPLSEILKELNKKVPDSLVKLRVEDGFSSKYIPWHIVNRIMNLHAPEWSGEVRNIIYSADGKSVSVVYRVTLYGTDAEVWHGCHFPHPSVLHFGSCIDPEGPNRILLMESTGTALVDEEGYGDAVQKAEAMAFRRACARLGLGLHLYHEDLS